MCRASAMTGDSDFRIRPGRVRSSGKQSARPFIAQALAAAQKAGAGMSRSGRIVPGNRLPWFTGTGLKSTSRQ